MADDMNLGEQLDGVIDALVTAGRYASRSDVLSEGVRLVQEREFALARFDAEIMKGIDDAEAGQSEDAEIVFARLRAKYQAMIVKAA